MAARNLPQTALIQLLCYLTFSPVLSSMKLSADMAHGNFSLLIWTPSHVYVERKTHVYRLGLEPLAYNRLLVPVSRDTLRNDSTTVTLMEAEHMLWGTQMNSCIMLARFSGFV